MADKTTPDLALEFWLTSLGIDSCCQWDILVFLYRHQASLMSAEHIARLLGYETGWVVVALDSLGSLGLVERSRVNCGARLYQFALPADPLRAQPLGHLLALRDSRAVRLLLTKKLRRDDPQQPRDGPPSLGSHRPLLRTEGGNTCLQAI